MQNFFKKLVLVILGIIFALFLFEVMARLTGFIKSAEVWKVPDFYYISDNELDYDIAKNFPSTLGGSFDNTEIRVESNNIGCFDSNYNGGKDTILLVGDSFTWGYVPFKSNWGTVIEQQIGKRVLKCGVPGYGTKQELLKAKKVISEIKEIPKLIIVGYYYNDILDDLLFSGSTVIVDGNLLGKKTIEDITKKEIKINEFTDEDLKNQLANFKKYCAPLSNTHTKISCFIKKYSTTIPFLFQKTKSITANIFGLKFSSKLAGARSAISKNNSLTRNLLFIPDNSGYDWIKDAKDKNFNNILEFKKYADSQNTKVLFVLFPSLEMVYSPFESFVKEDVPEVNFTEGNNLLKDFMDKNQIDYLDLLPHLKQYADINKSVLTKDDLYSESNKHLNIKGNLLSGMLISQFLLDKDYDVLSIEKKSQKTEEISTFLKSF